MKLSALRSVSSLFVIGFAISAQAQNEIIKQTSQEQEPPVVDGPVPEQNEKKLSSWDRTLRWWNYNVIQRSRISGYRFLGYHITDVSGDSEAYNFSNYGGQGDQRFTDLGFVRISGTKVFGDFDFELNLQDQRFQDPQNQRFRIKFQDGPWTAEYGDIYGSLPSSNPYARLNKQVTGISAGFKTGALEIGAISSSARGQARTVTIQGSNSAGPYYLQSSQVIRGSESISVDGVPQIFGQDYTIDYDLGSITFVNRDTLQAKIISPTSSIVATYESFGFNGSAGEIQGLAAKLNLGSSGNIGVTAIRQVSGSSNRLSTRLEKFQGFGAASTPYFLQFQPLATSPIIIRVDGILQTQGVDFNFDVGNPSIFYFTRFMPATSDIDVLYTPKPTADIQGDRETIGLDYQLPFSKSRGRLTIAAAQGKLSKTANPSSGTAKSMDVRYNSGKYEFSGILRDVPDGYVSVETTSFNRNERSSNLSLTYRPNTQSSFVVSHFNTSIATQTTTTAINRTRFSLAKAEYSLIPATEGGLPLTFSLSRASTINTTRNNTVDTAALSTSKNWGKFTTRLSFENQKVTGTQRADLISTVLRSSYISSKYWIFGAEASLSQIVTPDDSGNGTDYTLSAGYRASDRFAASFRYNESDAGDITGLSNFSSGFGAGFNGNGFTAGAGDNTINGASSGRYANSTFTWTLNDRFALDGAFSLLRRTGNISSNAETKAGSIGLSYDLGASHSIRGGFSRSETQFVGSDINSSATTADVLLSGNFGQKFSYNANVNTLLSGGSSQFKQDSLAVDLGMSYLLAPRHSLSFALRQGRITGYYPQDEADYALTYRYQIWESLALNVGYRYQNISNRDPLLTSGAYKSSGFDFTLAFNFF